MRKLRLLITIGIFLGVYISFDITESSDFQKKLEFLPLIISVQQFPYRIGGTVEEYEHLLKYYGVNEIYAGRWEFFSLDKAQYPKLMKEMRKHGFYTTMYQGGSLNQPESFLPLPKAVDAEGNEYKGGEAYSIDRISPRIYTDYVYPLIDNTVEGGCEIIRICEYGLYHPTYSMDDIEQFRKDLIEEDGGIDWIFYDGHIEHIKFWKYVRAQAGIEKENYSPDKIGEFPSYREYLPADIGRNREDTRDLIKYLSQPGDEKYRKNLHLFDALQRYEYFKHCQKWYKYAKEKGIKYCVAGPVSGPASFLSDVPHDPYVDYVGGRGGPAVILGLIPGATSHFIQPPTKWTSISSLYMKRSFRSLGLMNEFLGKVTYLSTETVASARLPIAFYSPSFSGHLVNCVIHKSNFLMMEFPVTEAVFDTGLPYSIRQFNLSVLDAYRQVTASGLNKGRILKSNWLVETSDPLAPFGSQSYSPLYNQGDMRSELYLREGYIPDVDQSQGEDRIPLENYKVITMGGDYYSSIVIDQLKGWIEKGRGRTLFTNYLFLGRSLNNGPVDGKRYVNLGIWKTPNIREYRIKGITWVDRNILPDVQAGSFPLRAALPEGNILDSLPSNSQVVMKGMTEEGKEIPLAVIIPKGNNRIINIAFGGYPEETFTYQVTYCGFTNTASNKDLFNLTRDTMFNLFSYIQKEDNFFITRIKSPFSMDVVFRVPVLDEKGIVTLAAVGCVTLGEEKHKVIDPVVLEYENHKVVSKIDDRSMVIASLDGSALASISSIEIDGTIYVKEVTPETLYVLTSIDNKSYHNSRLFHLWTHDATRIKFLKPKTWENEEEIKVYNFDGTTPIEVPFKIENGYMELETEGDRSKDGFIAKGGSEYKISYGKVEDSLWKEFCERLSEGKGLTESRFDDSAWGKVNITNSPAPAPAILGGTDGWYRVHFNVPGTWKGESLILELGKHYTGNSAWVYLNGENQISEDWHGWEHVSFPRTAIISKKVIKYGEDNVLSVRIGNGLGRRGITGGPIRLINPAKGEVLDLSRLDWLYKETGNRSWAGY